jgi:hypothetical protein
MKELAPVKDSVVEPGSDHKLYRYRDVGSPDLLCASPGRESELAHQFAG